MLLQARPARPFSSTHTVESFCGEVATLTVDAFGDGGELIVAHDRYRVRRKGTGDGEFVLEGPEGALANARKPTVRRSFEVVYAGHSLTVEPDSTLRRRYVVTEGVAQRGDIRRHAAPFTRALEADLAPEVPVTVQLFIAWLLLARTPG